MDDVADTLATMQTPVLDEVCNSEFEAVAPVSVSPLYSFHMFNAGYIYYYVYSSDR